MSTQTVNNRNPVRQHRNAPPNAAVQVIAAADREDELDRERFATDWSSMLARFKRSERIKSVWQVLNSFVPFCGMWYLMYLSLSWSYFITLLLAVPTAGLLVRIFIIQHDCGHHSFFRSRRANDVLGTCFGVLTLTPYHLWRRSHSRHHASSGNLNLRGNGDVWVLTVDEYLGRSFFGRLTYRIYRHPLFLFGLGPSLLFIGWNRLTYGVPKNWHRERRSVHVTNLGLLAMLGAAWSTIGIADFLSVHGPIVVFAASVGSWLFFVQHQYECAYWQPHEQWDFVQAACEGSSYYRLPRVLQWFTGNIGFHHIHHLESRIPNYNLPICYATVPELREVVTLGLWDSLQCMRLKLWDENLQRMVTFSEVRCGRR